MQFFITKKEDFKLRSFVFVDLCFVLLDLYTVFERQFVDFVKKTLLRISESWRLCKLQMMKEFTKSI